MRIASLLYFVLIFVSNVCWGSFSIPRNLKADERIAAIKVLGLGTAGKFLSTAYPLGGSAGLEVSVSGESFAVTEVNQLGDKSGGSDAVFYPQITIGKGLFQHSDIFINFIPYNDTAKIARYGLQYRMSLYRADFFPLNFSFLLHGNSANINNQLSTRTLGGDLMIGTMVSDLSFTIAGGYVDSSGDFFGGASGVTDTGSNERSSTASIHLGMSAVYRWDMLIFGLSLDRYQDTVINCKIGLLL